MGAVHELIEAHGKNEALKFELDRDVVEAAASYMGAEEGEIGFLYSGWAQSALPHKRMANDAVWAVQTDYVSLVVQLGYRHSNLGVPVPVGVPYGSRARLICLYLQSEALKSNSREVELGKSLHAWLRRLDISIGGKSMAAVRDQAERISRCQMSFQIRSGSRTGLVNQHILDTAVFVDDEDGQGSLFLETAKLSETFFEQLKKHPVPVEEAAIKAISNNSKAIDIYCWMAFRLHALTAPTPGPFSSNLATQTIDPKRQQSAPRTQCQRGHAMLIRDQRIRTEWPWRQPRSRGRPCMGSSERPWPAWTISAASSGARLIWRWRSIPTQRSTFMNVA